MKKSFAVRNLRMCEKDCLCLYVCPTGASDTENSIIDVEKCIGCGACAEACPSKAISMVPVQLPVQQKKSDRVADRLRALVISKGEQELMAAEIPVKFAKAIEMSSRLMAEDLSREAGYMLPQSRNSYDFLKMLKDKIKDEKILSDIDYLLGKINFNEELD